MTKFKKVMKKIGKGLLIFIIILAVVDAISSAILSRKLEAKIAEIKAQGDPISTLDLGKINVPDLENAATIYLKIFEKMGTPIIYKNGVPHWKDNRIGNMKNPEWYELYEAKTDDKRTLAMWDKARKSLASYGEVFKLTDEAISMPYCKFKTNWQDGAGVLFPYYACMRELARLHYTDALVKAHDGDIDAATNDVRRIFGIGRSLRNEPVLIGQLVKFAILSIGSKCIRDISAHGFNASEVEILEKAISDINLYDEFAKGMNGERVFLITGYKELMSGNNMAFTNGMNTNQKMPLYGRIGLYVARPLLYANMIKCLDIMAGYVNDTKVPVMYRTNHTANDARAVPEEPASKGIFTVLARLLLPVFTRATLQRDLCESETLSCRTMLDLVKYKHTFGVYPKSLDELKSQLKVDVPVDPMSGKDFNYKRQGDGFLLYGIGGNMRDDGGKWDRRSNYAPPGKDFDDIVWKMSK